MTPDIYCIKPTRFIGLTEVELRRIRMAAAKPLFNKYSFDRYHEETVMKSMAKTMMKKMDAMILKGMKE